jgi:hypothetical protein
VIYLFISKPCVKYCLTSRQKADKQSYFFRSERAFTCYFVFRSYLALQSKVSTWGVSLWHFPFRNQTVQCMHSTHPPPPFPGAHSSSCDFSFTSYKDWQRREKFFFESVPNGGVHFFYCHLSFFSRKSRDDCSAPLEIARRLSYLQAFTYQNYWPCSTFDKGAMNNHLRHSNWIRNCQLKTRRRDKTLQGSHRLGGRQNLLRISTSPIRNSFRIRSLLAWSILLDNTLKKLLKSYRQKNYTNFVYLSFDTFFRGFLL